MQIFQLYIMVLKARSRFNALNLETFGVNFQKVFVTCFAIMFVDVAVRSKPHYFAPKKRFAKN